MTNNNQNTPENLLKSTSKGASNIINKTADTANGIVKSISGEGGLIGKVSDTSTDVVKNVSKTGDQIIEKSVDSASNAVRGASDKIFKKE